MKILSLDLGIKRIGMAISDGEIVASLDTITAVNREDALNQISKICRAEGVENIVLGIPKSHLPSGGKSEDLVRSFAFDLNRLVEIPIAFVDETLTSKEAERILKDLKVDLRSQKYKQEIDRISAKLILEQYLQSYEKNI